jgi:hypothetical protein
MVVSGVRMGFRVFCGMAKAELRGAKDPGTYRFASGASFRLILRAKINENGGNKCKMKS